MKWKSLVLEVFVDSRVVFGGANASHASLGDPEAAHECRGALVMFSEVRYGRVTLNWCMKWKSLVLRVLTILARYRIVWWIQMQVTRTEGVDNSGTLQNCLVDTNASHGI